MRTWIAAALALAGAVGAIAWAPAVQAQRDPFDDARFYITTKQNAEALRVIDADRFPITQANAEGWTLLHFAAEAGNLEMVRSLLARRGVDPTVRNARGRTAYDVATATPVKVELGQAIAARTGNDPALSRPAAPAPVAPPRAAATAAVKPTTGREQLCRQRWHASQALCSDSTCRLREYRRWQTCQQTGSYY